jgi:hypothetical protein
MGAHGRPLRCYQGAHHARLDEDVRDEGDEECLRPGPSVKTWGRPPVCQLYYDN